jgi:hypothetical protein
MSSPRVAVARQPGKCAAPAKHARRRSDASLHATDAKRVAAAIERAVAKGKTDAISLDTIKALIAASCKHYTALIEAGQHVQPLRARSTITPIEIMTTASGFLRAVDLAMFDGPIAEQPFR